MALANPAIFARLFTSDGAIPLTWEVASRCSCYDPDSEQPQWGHVACGGLGAIYAAPVAVRGLFRGQSRWSSRQPSGEHGLGSASLTLPTASKPGFTDERIRDRFTCTVAVGDVAAGRVFYPVAQPTPFLIGGVQYAWRVQLAALDQTTRVLPQP